MIHRWPDRPTEATFPSWRYFTPPRHLHLIPSLSMGGAERIVIDLAQRLHRMQAPVDVAVMRSAAIEHEVPKGPILHRLGHLSWPERYARVAALARETGLPVYCHLTSIEELRRLWELGVETVPVVHNAAAGWRQDPRDWNDGLVPFAVACGETIADAVRDAGFERDVVPIRHVVEAPRPMDADHRITVRKAFGVDDDTLLIGMVGRIVPQKNHVRAVRVLHALLRSGSAAKLAIIGPETGEDGQKSRHALEIEARLLGVRDNIILTGPVVDAGRLVPAFDVHLTTSDFEGVSIATMEAVSAGVPVVTSDVGGQREAVDDQAAVVPSDAHPSVWADAILTARLREEAPPERRYTDTAAVLWPWTLACRSQAPRQGPTLFVTGNLDVGGAQRGLCNLLEDLANRGDDIACAIAGPIGVPGFAARAIEAGVEFHDVSGRGSHRGGLAGRMGRILSLAEALDAPTICFWNMDAETKFAITKVASGGRFRIVDVSPGPALFAELARASAAARWLTSSTKTYLGSLDGFVSKYHGGLPDGGPKHMAVIPNGVPPVTMPLGPDEGPTPPAGSDPELAVAVVGRITPAKMPWLLPAIARGLVAKVPGATLTLVGGAHGEREEACWREVLRAAGGRLPANMFHVQPDHRTSAFLGRFSSLLLLSREQGSPNTSLEAMAAGLPVVANDDGGTREQVVDGETGFLLRGQTEEELVDEAIIALTTLLRSPGLARRMGATGRERAVREFSMANMGKRYSDFFSSVSPIHGFNPSAAADPLTISVADASFPDEAVALNPVTGMGAA